MDKMQELKLNIRINVCSFDKSHAFNLFILH